MSRRLLLLGVCIATWGVAIMPSLRAAAWADEFNIAAAHYSQGRWELAARHLEAVTRDSRHPRHAEAWFYLAEARIELSETAGASKGYQQFLALIDSRLVLDHEAPDHLAADPAIVAEIVAVAAHAGEIRRSFYRLGELAFFEQDHVAAAAYFERLLATSSDDEPLLAYALARLGQIRIGQARYEEAQRHLEHALAHFPESATAASNQLQLAQVYKHQRRAGDAAELLGRLIRQSAPGDFVRAQARLALSRLHADLADTVNDATPAAVDRLLTGRTHFQPSIDEAVNQWLAICQENRNSAVAQQARVELAREWMRRGGWEGAAIEIGNIDWSLLPSTLHDSVRLDAAYVALQMQNIDQARIHLSEISPDAPLGDSTEYWQLQLYVALSSVGQECAEDIAQSYLRRHPQGQLARQALEILGRSAFFSRQFSDAEDYFAAALTLPEQLDLPGAPSSELLVYMIAATQVANERFAAAILTLQDWHRVPRDLDIWPYGQVLLTVAAASVSDDELLIAGCTDFLEYVDGLPSERRSGEFHPDGITWDEHAVLCRQWLVAAHLRLGDARSAEKALIQLIENDGRDAAKEYQDAVVVALRAADLSPQHLLGLLAEGGDTSAATALLLEQLREAIDTQSTQRVETLAWQLFDSLKQQATANDRGEAVVESHDEVQRLYAATHSAQQFFAQQQNWPMAIALAEATAKALADVPSLLPHGRWQLARLLARQGDEQQQRRAAVLLEQLATSQSRQAAGADTRDSGISVDVDAVLYELAWLHYQQQRFDQAGNWFEQLCQEFPSSPFAMDARYRLARIELQRGRRAAAQHYLEQLIQQADHSLHQPTHDATQTANFTNHLIQAHLLLAHVAAESRQWDAVRHAMTQVQSLAESHEGAWHDAVAEAQWWIAESWYQQHQHDQALPLFAQLHEALSPESEWGPEEPNQRRSGQIALRHAQVLLALERFGPAATAAQQALARSPENSQASQLRYILGRCAMARGELDSARDHFEQVVRDAGAQEIAAMAQWMIGECFMHQQRYDAAIDAYFKAESQYDFDQWRALSLLQAGQCYLRLQQPHHAQQLFNQVREQFPVEPAAEQAAALLRSLSVPAMPAKHSQPP